jgi:hypothetical protein
VEWGLEEDREVADYSIAKETDLGHLGFAIR